MIQFNSSDTNLDFEILGYQYPGSNDYYWDNNWLNVKIDLKIDSEVFTQTDPLLLTWECLDLAKWFQNFKKFSIGETFMNIENTLTFQKEANFHENQEYNLSVIAHKSLIPNKNNLDDTILCFKIQEKDCKAISEALFESLDKYPIIYNDMPSEIVRKIQAL